MHVGGNLKTNETCNAKVCESCADHIFSCYEYCICLGAVTSVARLPSQVLCPVCVCLCLSACVCAHMLPELVSITLRRTNPHCFPLPPHPPPPLWQLRRLKHYVLASSYSRWSCAGRVVAGSMDPKSLRRAIGGILGAVVAALALVAS